jgi:hypothetical protein
VVRGGRMLLCLDARIAASMDMASGGQDNKRAL